jgi:hypothetical protein
MNIPPPVLGLLSFLIASASGGKGGPRGRREKVGLRFTDFLNAGSSWGAVGESARSALDFTSPFGAGEDGC